MNYFLGIDAGGSSTKAAVIDENSKIIAQATDGPANYYNVGLTQTKTTITKTIEQVAKTAGISLAEITYVVVGITALDTDKDHNVLTQALTTDGLSAFAHKMTLVRDAVAALYSAIIPPGLTVICGTGSYVYGKNDHNEDATAGNWGYFLGEHGSGYTLGKKLFETVVARYDGLVEETMLVARLENKLHTKSAADLLDWYNENKPSVHDISDFAPLVIEAAEAGDEIAKQLVDETIGYLGKAAQAVIKRLKMEGETIRIVTSGGVFENNYFRALFEGHMTALFKHVRLIKPLVPPVVGAAIMARHEWEKRKK